MVQTARHGSWKTDLVKLRIRVIARLEEFCVFGLEQLDSAHQRQDGFGSVLLLLLPGSKDAGLRLTRTLRQGRFRRLLLLMSRKYVFKSLRRAGRCWHGSDRGGGVPSFDRLFWNSPRCLAAPEGLDGRNAPCRLHGMDRLGAGAHACFYQVILLHPFRLLRREFEGLSEVCVVISIWALECWWRLEGRWGSHGVRGEIDTVALSQRCIQEILLLAVLLGN